MAKLGRKHIKKTSSKKVKSFFDRKLFSIFSKKSSETKKRHIPGLRPFLVAITAAGLLWGGAVALDKTKIGADAQVFVAQETNKTAYSKYVDEQNDYWMNANPKHKIILLDSDYIDSAVALSSYLGYSKTRQQAMYDYAAKHDIKMNPYYLHWLEQALMLQRNPSARVKSQENYLLLQSGTAEACIIAPAWTEMNVKELGGKWVGVPAAAFRFQDLDGKDLNMTTKEFRKFVDNHEIGHCMDNVTLPEMKFGNTAESHWMRHKAESFADAHAALTSARLGFDKTYRKIADLRATASHIQGPYAAKMAGGVRFSSEVYSTAPTLEGVGRYIAEHGADGLKAMTKMEIADLAQEIMAKTAMTFEEFKDLHEYHKQGIGFVKKLTAELEAKPDNAKRIAFLNDYIKNSKASFDRTVDMEVIKEMRSAKKILGTTLNTILDGLTAEQQEQILWESLVDRARDKGGLAQHFAEEIRIFRDDVRARIAKGDKVSTAERNMVARPGMHLTSTKKEYRVPKALEKFMVPSKQENLPDNNAATDGQDSQLPKNNPMPKKPDELFSSSALSSANLANIQYLKTKIKHNQTIKPPRL